MDTAITDMSACGVQTLDTAITDMSACGVQTLDTAITDLSACSLNYWLSKFVQEVSNYSGERYLSRSFYSIKLICRLKRHLSDVNGSVTLNSWTCPTEGKLYFWGIKFGPRKLLNNYSPKAK